MSKIGERLIESVKQAREMVRNADFERIPVPDEGLDAAERAVKGALAEIEAAYRRDAEPWLKRLAEIEAMRQYRIVMIPAPQPGDST